MEVSLQYGYEECLYRERAAHGSSKINLPRSKCRPVVIPSRGGSDNPYQEDDIADDADDAICHDAGTKLEVFQ